MFYPTLKYTRKNLIQSINPSIIMKSILQSHESNETCFHYSKQQTASLLTSPSLPLHCSLSFTHTHTHPHTHNVHVREYVRVHAHSNTQTKPDLGDLPLGGLPPLVALASSRKASLPSLLLTDSMEPGSRAVCGIAACGTVKNSSCHRKEI